MKIKILNKNYSLLYTLRGFFIFESLAKRPYKPGLLTDDYILLYAILLASNQESFDMDFDKFIAECDKDASIFKTFAGWFLKEMKKRIIFNDEGTETAGAKKKNSP